MANDTPNKPTFGIYNPEGKGIESAATLLARAQRRPRTPAAPEAPSVKVQKKNDLDIVIAGLRRSYQGNQDSFDRLLEFVVSDLENGRGLSRDTVEILGRLIVQSIQSDKINLSMNSQELFETLQQEIMSISRDGAKREALLSRVTGGLSKHQ